MFREIFNVQYEIWISLVVIVIFYISKTLLKGEKKLPPGPIGLPIVGYLPFLTSAPHLKFTQLAKTYGNVFSLYLGSQSIVVLNGAETIREAFGKREFLGRPPNSPFSFLKIHTPFLSTDLHMWHEQRRFIVQSMKDLGLGKSKLEEHILEEIRYFLNVLKESKGKPIDFIKPLTSSMSNNICSLVFGERYDYDNPTRIAMDKQLEYVGIALAQTASHSFFPWLTKIPFASKIFNFDKAFEAFGENRKFINSQITHHKETLDLNHNRDFIDSYLVEMKARSEKNLDSTFSESALEGTVVNLFGAGSETVRTTIDWCMYIMAAYPEVQKKARQEIQDVIGKNTLPQFPHQKNMVYTQAVIREIMRWQTVVPLNVVRYTLDDTEAGGCSIPKGTIVIANFYSVHHDKAYWKDPENFRPERLITPSGGLLKTNYLMPFSVGKRSCPGETMALIEAFLYFVSILQNFEVAFPEGYKPTFDGELGITWRTKTHPICFFPIE